MANQVQCPNCNMYDVYQYTENIRESLPSEQKTPVDIWFLLFFIILVSSCVGIPIALAIALVGRNENSVVVGQKIHYECRMCRYKWEKNLPFDQAEVQRRVQQATQRNIAAILSLISGIMAYSVLPIICAILAVLAGHSALNAIRASGGVRGGRSLALAGLVLGYFQLAALGVILLLAYST